MKNRIAAFAPWASTGLLLLFTAYHAEYKSAVFFGLLFAIGLVDLLQPWHAIRRNYPLVGHLRYLFEDLRPGLRQYFFEGDNEELPFSRMQRSLVYARAKSEPDERGFGTVKDVYAADGQWLSHSLLPVSVDPRSFRVRVGSDAATAYDMSVFNVSGMAFGALSGAAVAALNRGAAQGGFAQNTGEGGISRYHRQGGDLIWQIGSAYFGCRTADGRFDASQFERKARDPQVRMIEIKLSQGAKPGHGGVLPGSKVTPEIAGAWGVPVGETCVCPAAHDEFRTPEQLLGFVAELRRLSGGKPVGIKLCLGSVDEFFSLAKAMVAQGEHPDFITIDGAEGGTGAAPVEFTDHVGMPLSDALPLVHATLRGVGLRDRVRLGASGKIISAFDIARCLAMGADWCNAARGFMFSLGCIQARACHTDKCPSGVATQDPMRQRGLVLEDKAERVRSYQHRTLEVLAELLGAAGVTQPSAMTANHILCRNASGNVVTLASRLPAVREGVLLDSRQSRADLPEPFRSLWV
ncbi:MAG: hypothetical protein RL026_1168 [Pseudomonadota bacterium]